MKKVLSVLLSFVMLLSITAGIDFSAYATSKTSSDAISWVKSKVGKSIDYDGQYGSQCVDLILAYYNYLGVATVRGNGDDYATNSLPSGWTRKKGGTPKKGDILVWAGGSENGHVAIYESTNSTYHQNAGGKVYKSNKTYSSIKAFDGAPYWGCIHPNFKETSTVKIIFNGNGGTVLGGSSLSVEKGKSVGNSLPSAKCAGKTFNGWYDSSGKKYSNTTGINKNITLYANWVTNKSNLLKSRRVYRIVNTNSNMAIQANSSSNKASVTQQPKSNSYSQLWEITNYAEGYYKFNVLNGRRSLDMTGGSINLRTPYQIFNDTGSDNQRFSLVNRGSFFSIHSKSTGRALDIKDTSTSAGAQLQSYYYHGGGAQQFIFEEYTTRRLTFCDNLSNNYLTSLESNKANSMYTSRDKSYVTVSTSKVSRMMTIKALKAGTASKSMTWETTCNRSYNFDFGASDTSKKYLIFRARSNVNGAKMNFRWGYDSSDPIASATLSNSWELFCLPMPRTLNSGGNIHPWIDRACTIELDNISLVDSTSDFNIKVDDSNTEKVLSVNSNNGKIGNNLPLPNTTKKGSHFVGWYTKRVGGTKVSEQSQMYTNQFLYAHWEPHNYSIIKVVSPTCTNRGYTTYTCSTCGDSYKADYTDVTNNHTYKSEITITKATLTANGSIVTRCTDCGDIKSSTIIYYPKSISLSKTSFTYNGKVQQPNVTVKDSKGTVLKHKRDYKVTYQKSINPEIYNVKIEFIGNYSGTKNLTYTIKPRSTSIKSVSGVVNGFKVNWTKVSDTTGYQIQYSTRSDFKGAATVYGGATNTTSKTITGRAAGTKYYVRVRTYKTLADGSRVWGSWTSAKAVTTKVKKATAKSVTGISKGFKVTWDKIGGVTGYQLQYSTRSDFKNAATVYAGNSSAVSKTITGRARNTKYYVRVRGYKNNKGSYVYGAWSGAKAVKTK